MKHETLVITRALAILYQQQCISRNKKNSLLLTWKNAVLNRNTNTLRDIVMEVQLLMPNNFMENELKLISEELI